MQNGRVIANIIAYSTGFGFCALIILFGLHELMAGFLLRSGKEPLTFLLLFFVGFTGMILSLKRKIIGSIFLICSGIGIYTYLAFVINFNDLRTAFILSLPFGISGILILIGKEYKTKL